MSQILDRIIEQKCAFEIEKFEVGKTNDDQSVARRNSDHAGCVTAKRREVKCQASQ